MARATLDISTLKVESFTIGGGAAVAENPRAVEKEKVMGPSGYTWCYTCTHTCDRSCTLDHTTLCDTDMDCSNACFLPTNVCHPCG